MQKNVIKPSQIQLHSVEQTYLNFPFNLVKPKFSVILQYKSLNVKANLLSLLRKTSLKISKSEPFSLLELSSITNGYTMWPLPIFQCNNTTRICKMHIKLSKTCLLLRKLHLTSRTGQIILSSTPIWQS